MSKTHIPFRDWQAFFREYSLDTEVNKIVSSLSESSKFLNTLWSPFAKPNQPSPSTLYAPSTDRVMEAFRRCSPADIKIVIVSFEPYRSGNSTGLAFQVPEDHRVTGSLRNMHKELDLEYYNDRETSRANLDEWSKQGVLLLNAALTAPVGKPDTNHSKQWRNFTNDLLFNLSRKHPEKVYMLWGTFANSFKNVIEPVNNLILSTGHPGDRNVNRNDALWFGNGHFVRANEFLSMVNKTPIDWLKNRLEGGPLKHDLQFVPPSKIKKARSQSRSRSRSRSRSSI